MQIRDVMTRDPITVEPETLLLDAQEVMMNKQIRRLPVVKKGKLVGIVTYDMLLGASPSQATSLNIHELHFLLAKMTVTDIMVKDPVTFTPDTPFEKVLIVSEDRNTPGFPIVEDGELVGIVTHGDVIRLLNRALGLRKEGVRLTIEGLGAQLGDLREIISIFDRYEAPVLSLLTLPRREKKDWLLVIRLIARDETPIIEELTRSGFHITYLSYFH